MPDGNLSLDFGQELVVDLFAGGGGASLGLARAYREPDVAVNHDPVAIAVHRANHPTTAHFTCDVFEIDPDQATGGRPVGVLWASPDCRHHSKASGGKPRSKRVRGLAWVVVKWAARCRPRIIHLENVEEFADWGPLLPDGKPCRVRRGITFRRWVRQLERMGYQVEHRELVAADYGAPTIRKRLYVIARLDGRPIVWPKGSHARADWRPAADCIDFTDLGRSIFDRPRPIVRNTCRRLARGCWRFVLDTPTPFIVPMRGTSPAHHSTHSLADPLSVVSAGGIHHALAAPILTEFAQASAQRTWDVRDPLRTQCATVKGGHFAMASAYFIPRYGEAEGQAPRCSAVTDSAPTIVPTGNGAQLVCAWMEQANTGMTGHSARSPLSTIVGRGTTQRFASAYLVRYYRDGGNLGDCAAPAHTIPTKDRTGLVNVVQVPIDGLAPELLARAKRVAAFLHEHLPERFPEPADLVLVGDYVLVDITLRMLTPRELARCQGFPDSYVLERGLFVRDDGGLEWRPITKTDQVRLIGNSVCPDVAEAIVAANAGDLVQLYADAAA